MTENFDWVAGYLNGVHKGKRTGRWQGALFVVLFAIGWWAGARWLWL